MATFVNYDYVNNTKEIYEAYANREFDSIKKLLKNTGFYHFEIMFKYFNKERNKLKEQGVKENSREFKFVNKVIDYFIVYACKTVPNNLGYNEEYLDLFKSGEYTEDQQKLITLTVAQYPSISNVKKYFNLPFANKDMFEKEISKSTNHFFKRKYALEYPEAREKMISSLKLQYKMNKTNNVYGGEVVKDIITELVEINKQEMLKQGKTK